MPLCRCCPRCCGGGGADSSLALTADNIRRQWMEKWGLLRQTIINATQGEGDPSGAKGKRKHDNSAKSTRHRDQEVTNGD
jgi:hypothetical protein